MTCDVPFAGQIPSMSQCRLGPLCDLAQRNLMLPRTPTIPVRKTTPFTAMEQELTSGQGQSPALPLTLLCPCGRVRQRAPLVKMKCFHRRPSDSIPPPSGPGRAHHCTCTPSCAARDTDIPQTEGFASRKRRVMQNGQILCENNCQCSNGHKSGVCFRNCAGRDLRYGVGQSWGRARQCTAPGRGRAILDPPSRRCFPGPACAGPSIAGKSAGAPLHLGLRGHLAACKGGGFHMPGAKSGRTIGGGGGVGGSRQFFEAAPSSSLAAPGAQSRPTCQSGRLAAMAGHVGQPRRL